MGNRSKIILSKQILTYSTGFCSYQSNWKTLFSKNGKRSRGQRSEELKFLEDLYKSKIWNSSQPGKMTNRQHAKMR